MLQHLLYIEILYIYNVPITHLQTVLSRSQGNSDTWCSHPSDTVWSELPSRQISVVTMETKQGNQEPDDIHSV